MTHSDDKQIAQIREQIHELNNALNNTVIQAELVRMLAMDSQSHAKISDCVDIIVSECKRSGKIANEVRQAIKPD